MIGAQATVSRTIDVRSKICAKKPGGWQNPGFSSANNDLTFYKSRAAVGELAGRLSERFRQQKHRKQPDPSTPVALSQGHQWAPP